MLKLAPLILKNVVRNRRRTLLTLASTAISLAILSLMVTIYQGFFYAEDVSPAGALRMVVRHRVALVQPLPASYEARIKQIDGVEQISPYSWFQGKYKDDKPENQFARFACDADHIFDIYTDFTMPPEQMEAFKKGRTACAIGKAIATTLNIHLGDTLHIVGDIYPVTLDLTVAGIFDHPKNTEVLFFHREYLSESLPQGSEARDMVGTYIVRADKPENMTHIARAIDQMFDNSPYPTRTESEKAFSASFLAFLGNLKLYLAMICAAVTFTILLVSANAISMSVRERTRETAIMRTLGYSSSEILQLIVGESILISLIGGLIGVGLGTLLLKGGGGGGGFPLPDMRWQGVAITMGVAILVGVLAAAAPAYITARKNIVGSLRFTG